MRTINILLLSLSILLFSASSALAQPRVHEHTFPHNRPPLLRVPYATLPIGAIKPKGMLRHQLEIMRDGLTGHLDERYEFVVGKRNGWLGGDGDGFERGPYWIDGLLPLAYILQDTMLINKVKPWIEWTLSHQLPSGYIGPLPFTTPQQDEAGIQKEPREDWWPKMVMLKVLQQYYMATQDRRVISVLDKYFRYQLKTLPSKPLDTWTFWASQRAADNLIVVYWLYNLTGEKYLLDLASLIQQQTLPFTTIFLNNYSKVDNVDHLYPHHTADKFPFDQKLIDRMHVGQLQSFHCVNLAQGIKTPIIYYQQDKNVNHLRAVKKAFQDIEIFHGQAQGMYGGDEPLHGNNPTQGVELCSIVEMMYSLENMLSITGDVTFGDHLEKLAYNALPTQTTDDFNNRQYFQCANQIEASRHRRNFYEEDFHGGTDLCFGLVNGYPCCTCNMHQGWPKFIQNLWYTTSDNGLAALVYGACEVNTTIQNIDVTIHESTQYPFDENIQFKINTSKPLIFPLHLRIPAWCKNAKVSINGTLYKTYSGNQIIKIERRWNNNDTVSLELPMMIRSKRWIENSVSVERGPLVYALRIEEDWKYRDATDHFGSFYEVFPKSKWNYALLEEAIRNPEKHFQVVRKDDLALYPWNLSNAPIYLKTKGKIIPDWQIYNNMPGPLPHSRPLFHVKQMPPEEIILVPYGCSTLRISEFPVAE
ncbi:beta-L-arabinofuranosidase domain-containing protein [Pseudochryseolinea flava]|uniref:Glycoside hydrolase family 127 protein n=1 Tax=Pseudochryseolinea flava TaxID=2059302 RepID=A0A364XY75_9BACT|nr:beta-L-arabinofuranosidase domain-containing protein [Pseudochryseolinea flava]RAV99214.1 hypothetical protein DQQ10_20150 [Pseudochryseolinea flava]